MASTVYSSRISTTSYQGVTGALFRLAMITFLARTYIRTRILKQFFAEDVLLSFAVVCLCATTALAFVAMANLFNALAAILHNASLKELAHLLDQIPRTSKLENAATTLWWCVLFPVKLAFLFFFRRLIIHRRHLYICWWCAIVFTIAAFGVSCAAAWMTCPYFTTEKVLSCSGPSSSYRVIRDTAITTVMDVTTDLIVLAFPIAILWQVHVNTRQKAGIAIWLCLSLAMILVAVVRMSGLKLVGGSVDIVWLAFWQQQESSIAVMMVSMSAFRSLFVETSRGALPQRGFDYTSKNWRRKLVQRALGSIDEHNTTSTGMGLPEIPSATLTGMSDIIQEV